MNPEVPAGTHRRWIIALLGAPLFFGFLVLAAAQASFYAGTAENTGFLMDIIVLFILGRFLIVPIGLIVLFLLGREVVRPMRFPCRLALFIEGVGIVLLCFYLSLFGFR